MASGSTRRTYGSVLAPNTPDTVLLTETGFGVEVQNVNGAAPLYFTISSPGGPCPVPSVGGAAGQFAVASVAGSAIKMRQQGLFGQIVQLVSSASVQYQVTVLGNHMDA